MVGETWIRFNEGVVTVDASHELAPVTQFYDYERAVCLHNVSQELQGEFWQMRIVEVISGPGMVIYTSADLNALVSFMQSGVVIKFKGTFISPDAADIVIEKFMELFQSGFRAPAGSEISLPIMQEEGKYSALRDACEKIGLNRD